MHTYIGLQRKRSYRSSMQYSVSGTRTATERRASHYCNGRTTDRASASFSSRPVCPAFTKADMPASVKAAQTGCMHVRIALTRIHRVIPLDKLRIFLFPCLLHVTVQLSSLWKLTSVSLSSAASRRRCCCRCPQHDRGYKIL